ncbi:MAG: isochorismatase family protein [Kiloniellaceae bacterium]|nr:isochorismatase family protein [Kiloniellaceae bacterium]
MTGNYDFSLTAGHAALLVVDLQRGFCDPQVSEALGFDSSPHFRQRVDDLVLPNACRLIAAARSAGVEVIYTVIEALTADGRDRSLDHKRSHFLIPKGSAGGEVMPEIAPAGDEMVLAKTASGIFNATNIDYLLRNLGIERLAILGVYSHQCVESAVRDAADRGYLVTLVSDACAAKTAAQEAATAEGMRAYARVTATEDLLKELHARGVSAA